MKTFKAIFIIWVALFGLLIALFLFKDVKKKKFYKQFLALIDEVDEDDEENKKNTK